MPKLSIVYIIHFIIHASFSYSSIVTLKVNLVHKSLDTEPINCVGVQIFEHSELKFTNV